MIPLNFDTPEPRYRSPDDPPGWVGVDLDRTLAVYETPWRGPLHIGPPIPKMVARVRRHLAEGREVRIFTARVCVVSGTEATVENALLADRAIRAWCLEHIGQELPVTCMKDFQMDFMYDDRAIQMIANTGERVDGCE